MHPILVRPGRVAAYVAIWLPLGGLLAVLLTLQGAFAWPAAVVFALPLAVAYGFLCLSAWYASRGLPVDRVDPARVIVTACAAAFVSSALWLLVARGWLATATAFGWTRSAVPFRQSAPTLFAFGFLLYLLAIAVSYLAAAFQASRDAERRGLELQVLAKEAELRALRAQIDPHFLFNSLQSISALTTANPASARRMCLLLADFLRDTLSLGARGRIALSSEIALARRYLSIEQVRYGERLQVDVDADGADECLIAPLLLQPLVENAVTHGIAHLVEGGVVRIAASRGPATLTVSIDNPCDPERPTGRGTGVGLSNVRERLRTLYGTEAVLRTEEADGRFRTRLEIPLEVQECGHDGSHAETADEQRTR